MNLETDVDCSKCPKLCCHSLERRGPGFADPSDKPRMCAHCDITSSMGCKIHGVLERRSRVCASYSCHGVGARMSELFELDPDRVPSPEIRTSFRQRQGIVFFLAQLQPFLEQNSTCGHISPLREFCTNWEEQIFSSRNIQDITMDTFVRGLNELMIQCKVGYDNTYKEFCLLGAAI